MQGTCQIHVRHTNEKHSVLIKQLTNQTLGTHQIHISYKSHTQQIDINTNTSQTLVFIQDTTNHTPNTPEMNQQPFVPSTWSFPTLDRAMADMDTNWLQGALAALSTCNIMWQASLGQRFQTEMPDILRIEAAYMTDKQAVLLQEDDGATWTINVNTMTLVNDTTCTTRKIRRIVVVSNRVPMNWAKWGPHGLP